MKGDQVEKVETETELLRKMYVTKAMDENYAKYMVTGGMYFQGNILTQIVYFLLAGFHLPLLVKAVCLARGDLVVIAETFHFIMLLLLLLTITINSLCEREKIDNIYEAMGKRYYDYEDTLDPKSLTKVAKSQAESSWRKNFIYRCFTSGVTCALLSIMLGRPLLQYYLQDVIKTKKLSDGVNGAKNTFMYYPWDRENTWANMFGYFLQDVYTLLVARSYRDGNLLSFPAIYLLLVVFPYTSVLMLAFLGYCLQGRFLGASSACPVLVRKLLF